MNYKINMTSFGQFFKLMFFVIFTIVYYVSIELPVGLQHVIVTDTRMNISQYSLIYSITCWSFVLDCFHWHLIDRWFGLKLATILYSLILLTGNVLFGLSFDLNFFWMIVVGRTIIGLAGKPLEICMNKYYSYWFEEDCPNIGWSLMGGVTWLAFSISYAMGVSLYNFTLRFAEKRYTLAITVCILCVVSTLILLFISGTFTLLYHANTKDKKHDFSKTFQSERRKYENNKNKKFSLVYWLILFISFVYIFTLIGWLSVAQDLLITQYNIHLDMASYGLSIATVTAFIINLMTGIIESYMGRTLLIFTFGLLCSIFAHVVFYFTQWPPYIPVIGLMISMGTFTSIWSMVKYAVDSKQRTLAFGFFMSSINGGTAVGALVSGYIVHSWGYKGMEVTFLSLQIGLILPLVTLWFLDFKYLGLLNASVSVRHEREELEEKIINIRKVTVHTIQTPQLKYGSHLTTYFPQESTVSNCNSLSHF